MEAARRRRVRPDSPDYPAALRACSRAGRLIPVTVRGDLGALDGRLLGFFCSVRAPGDALLKTYDLARALRVAAVTLVGGFQSPMEKEFLDLLLRGSARVVVCPARGLGVMRIPKAWKAPLADGRLLILSFFDDALRRPTAAVAAERNACVAAVADRLLAAHAEPAARPSGCAGTPWRSASRCSPWTRRTTRTSWPSAPRRCRRTIRRRFWRVESVRPRDFRVSRLYPWRRVGWRGPRLPAGKLTVGASHEKGSLGSCGREIMPDEPSISIS